MEKEIIIIGSSGHAKTIIDIIEKENKYKIIGLIDDYRKIGEKTFGYNILGGLENINKFSNIRKAIIAVGDNFSRKKIKQRIEHKFNFIQAIHPSSTIGKNVKIGDGTAIMAGAIINPSTAIGKHCVVNTNSSLDHDCFMDDYASLAPNVTTGGNVIIGKNSSICLGANIINDITIGQNTIIGAGSCVLKNISDNIIAYGIPCKKIKKRIFDKKYF